MWKSRTINGVPLIVSNCFICQNPSLFDALRRAAALKAQVQIAISHIERDFPVISGN
jgi:hypothetical protein